MYLLNGVTNQGNSIIIQSIHDNNKVFRKHLKLKKHTQINPNQ